MPKSSLVHSGYYSVRLDDNSFDDNGGRTFFRKFSSTMNSVYHELQGDKDQCQGTT